jgi:DNA-binding NarL/FixJ family response regulator
MINVAIVDDQSLFRKGIISLIEKLENISVVIEAEDGEDMLEKLSSAGAPVHVALIDINMPGMNGIECMQQIRSEYPGIKNVVLTVHEEESYISRFVEAGANAYLVKNTNIEEVEAAIRNVVKNDFYFNDTTMRAMHNYMSKKHKSPVIEKGITPRETEVLKLICAEFTSAEIAEKLFISESTVNGHRNNLLLKIGCKNTAGLVLFAIKNKIFSIHGL